MRFRYRFLVTLVALAVTLAVVLTVGATRLMRTAGTAQLMERLRLESALLTEWAEQRGSQGDLQAFVVTAAERLTARVTWIADDGTVLADSARGPSGLAAMEDHSNRPEVRQAGVQGWGQDRRRSATTNVEYIYFARRLEAGGGYLRIAVPTSGLRQLPGGTPWPTLALLAAVLALAMVAYTVFRRLSKPVEQLANGLERSVELGRAPELPGGGPEEVARLAAAVQRMRETLLARVAELDAEREVLASVVSGMREGVLLLGPDNRVRLTNRALRQIFDVRHDPQGLRLAEVVREPAVIADVENALADAREIVEPVLRLPGSDRAFELHVTPLRGAGKTIQGVLVLFFDVTRMETLESVRREFVANVSHELRTPLTSIKASTENLLDLDPGDRERSDRFLEIIRRNADHMGELIDDLTDLSLIETGSIQLELRDVDALEIAREVAERLRPVAIEKGVTLEVDVSRGLRVVADRRRLEQMLTNLLDNAIKYNKSGGSVRVHGRVEDTRPLLIVEDTGIGIPADSHEKVFHRFYQVSRDRSGRRRGTGLGLAIVKHLMRLHGGHVRVESELGQGSRFVLEFAAAAA